MSAKEETLKHIRRVQSLLGGAARNLEDRADLHDLSKLESPEAEVFEEYTPRLKGCTYGSDEYKRLLAEMKPALDHHYAHNKHHPEHFGCDVCVQCGRRPDDPCTCGGPRRAGIDKMSLLDVLEMLVDWKAAGERHADGCILKSIEINQKRFGYTDELKQILLNTAKEFNFTA